jgi:hypothetical protein
MGKYQNDVFPELSTEQLLKQTEHVLGICIQSNQVFRSDKDVLIWIARARVTYLVSLILKTSKKALTPKARLLK